MQLKHINLTLTCTDSERKKTDSEVDFIVTF